MNEQAPGHLGHRRVEVLSRRHGVVRRELQRSQWGDQGAGWRERGRKKHADARDRWRPPPGKGIGRRRRIARLLRFRLRCQSAWYQGVFQELSLAPTLTVAENVFVADVPPFTVSSGKGGSSG